MGTKKGFIEIVGRVGSEAAAAKLGKDLVEDQVELREMAEIQAELAPGETYVFETESGQRVKLAGTSRREAKEKRDFAAKLLAADAAQGASGESTVGRAAEVDTPGSQRRRFYRLAADGVWHEIVR